MKYWIFQSNQVLGPYEPDDLSRHTAFGAESLVCPEGRRGTSMGDWQRAGMVPDLSVALVRATQSSASKSPVATLAGFPPEPTLKDLAVLGSIQEKMAMLEDVVLQLQEGLRLKDAELASLHQELAGKERQSSVMKSAMDQEAEELKRETEERKREAETLKTEAGDFKRKMGELEERLGVVSRLSETIEKAVESEKNVQHDVEAQGVTLADLAKEIESLRAQIGARQGASPSSGPSPFAPGAGSAVAPGVGSAPDSGWASSSSAPSEPHSFDPGGMPSVAPSSAPAAASAHGISIEMPSTVPSSSSAPASGIGSMPDFIPAPSPEHAAGSDPLPTFGNPINPMTSAPVPGSPEAALLGASSTAPSDLSPTPKKSRKGALVFGVLVGALALAAMAVVSGRLVIPGLPFPMKNAATSEAPPMPVHAPSPAAALPPPAPVVDPRETAIDTAKEWELPDGRTLGQALETLSPPVGNLSPWMAEPAADNRVSVSYFAQPSSPGSPTVAYQFEVNLVEKTIVGRNAAAKAALAGKAVAPPAPPKPKPVRIKPKAKPKAAAPKKEENLDSLLGTDSPTSPKGDASLAGPAASADAPANPTTAKRAAKAAQPAAGKASDESLLDDVLKE